MSHMRHEAENLEDWVRFEAEYKGEYAHQLTIALTNCSTENDLKNIIVNAILDRYGIYYTKESKLGKVNRLTPETQKMIDLLDNEDFKFTTKSSRNSLLSQSINSIIKYSGLFPLLYKINQIFGHDADREFFDLLFKKYQSNFTPNDDHIAFVKKYYKLYQMEGKPWEHMKKDLKANALEIEDISIVILDELSAFGLDYKLYDN